MLNPTIILSESFLIDIVLKGLTEIKKTNGSCPLCDAVQDIKGEPIRNLLPNSQLLDFIITPNKFPFSKGSSIAIAKGVDGEERAMYTTSNLEGIANELEEIFKFADAVGFQAVHNSEGAGASIPNHEHWHFVDFGLGYKLAGTRYGFENSQYKQSRNTSGVHIMLDLPFAHLIFDQNDPGRIVSFLRRLGSEIGSRFHNGSVPHYICQGQPGILVIPCKKYIDNAVGGGDIAGHFVCRSEGEFSIADYNYCINNIGRGLFTKQEIDLEKFL